MKTQLTKLEFKILKSLLQLDHTLAKSGAKTVLLNLLVSGGKDSMCLLSVFHSILNSNKFKSKNKYVPIVIHFNHQKRGLESDGDMCFVQDTCLKLGFECVTQNIASCSQENFQNFARKERQKLSLEISQQFVNSLNAEGFFILTAHHMQDHVESVLLHLVRGTGSTGLQGFYGEQPDHFKKFFAEVSLDEILSYIKEKNVYFREDASNETDDYNRNLLRHKILPEFLKLNSKYQENILRCSQKIAHELQKKTKKINSKKDNISLKLISNTSADEVYFYLKKNLSKENEPTNITENLVKNILHEAELLRHHPTKKTKTICLPHLKKMTLVKETKHSLYINIC